MSRGSVARRTFATAAMVLSAVLPTAPTAAADPADPGTWPVAQGNFTSSGEPGWIFFKPTGFGGHGCGISADGSVGCDIVPGRWPDGTPVQAGVPGPPGFYSCGGENCPLPPPGADQMLVSPQEPARYAESATPDYTRDVDSLPNGYRLVNGGSWCSLSQQGVLRCIAGDHGFTVSAVGATVN